MVGHAGPFDALARVEFPIAQEDGGGFERLWARPLGHDLYVLANIPAFVVGVSLGDVVRAKGKGSSVRFQRVVERGGHSTFHVARAESSVEPDWIAWTSRLHGGQIGFERVTAKLLAVDAGDDQSARYVQTLLEEGMAAGVWLFDEANLEIGERASK